MSDILVMGSPDIVEGFTLTGADVENVRDPARAEWMVEELIRRGSYSIVIITEALYSSLSEKLRTTAEKSSQPLVITLPVPAGLRYWEEREDLISRVIRRAIGYRLKIRR